MNSRSPFQTRKGIAAAAALLSILVLPSAPAPGASGTAGSAATDAPQALLQAAPSAGRSGRTMRTLRMTQAQRQAAADRAAAKRAKLAKVPGFQPLAAPVPGGTPEYFGIYGNYANSPLPKLDGSGAVIPGTGIRKFVDTLPGVGAANANNLGQYIPIATADKTKFPGSDYYEVGLVDYRQKMHSDLPPTKLRGYVDLLATGTDANPHYLGPLIVSQAGRPVRMKFVNQLGTGAAGNLFLPVDMSAMGAGMGPNGQPETYTQNRAAIHLHGGLTPWISDGTPHQWITPANETTSYLKGVSFQNVPDMVGPGKPIPSPSPNDGMATLYYSNQHRSARLMFYHDHSYGLTRLNVYAGEAAGYLLTDTVEEFLISKAKVLPDLGGVYHWGIPLIIQDKTFVPDAAQLAVQDPTWNWGPMGSLWFPHVYMTNQNPADISGANAMGRWDYGPWFWPPYLNLAHKPVVGDGTNGCPVGAACPNLPNPSLVPEAFMDTMVVNGAAYPKLTVGRKAYRFRILNASNDRFLNLQLYLADPTLPPGSPGYGKEVKMVPAVPHAPGDPTWPSTWPTDGRDGGVPDPMTVGPPWIQIGTEGGFLPAPVVIPSVPVGYNFNRRDIVVLNVETRTLFLGPAERADVIVDFSGVPDGSKIILYNDSPAPVPASDPRIDYYTGMPDMSSTGGAPGVLPGYAPNTRTVMLFEVSGATPDPPYDLAALNALWTEAYKAFQLQPIVPQKAYGDAVDNFSRIQDTVMTFTPRDLTTTVTIPLQPKAIQELFELKYGRMNATLGVELPQTTGLVQTTIPLGYTDPPTEIIKNGEKQIWKITHNGVDTHVIHFHLFNVQIVNRVGWDGAVRLPDPNELGWKESVRMNPLEDAIVALQPITPVLPFDVPESVRYYDVTQPEGGTEGFTNIDPATGNPLVPRLTNQKVSFGWEYVWHCHILGHEENDMMRPIVFKVIPCSIPVTNPSQTLVSIGQPISLAFTATGFTGTASFLTNNALPVGLYLSETGILSGTPIEAGTFPIIVQVADSNGCHGAGATYTLVVACQAIPVTNPLVTEGAVGQAFSQAFTQTGAVGTPVFTATGTVPPGLTLSPSGLLSGTPTQFGLFSITVTATDVNGCTGTGQPWTVAIVPVPPRTSFYSVTPCRAIDTRNAVGPQGAPPLDGGGAQRVFPVAGTCGVPADAKAVSINITLADSTGTGSLRLFPGDWVPSAATAAEFRPGKARANNVMATLAFDGSGSFAVKSEAPAGTTVNLIVDVNGYFK